MKSTKKIYNSSAKTRIIVLCFVIAFIIGISYTTLTAAEAGAGRQLQGNVQGRCCGQDRRQYYQCELQEDERVMEGHSIIQLHEVSR